LRGVRQEIDRYVAVIGASVAPGRDQGALADRKACAERIEAELAGRPPATSAHDPDVFRRRVEDLRGCLR
jgi:hypothetical protein